MREKEGNERGREGMIKRELNEGMRTREEYGAVKKETDVNEVKSECPDGLTSNDE